MQNFADTRHLIVIKCAYTESGINEVGARSNINMREGVISKVRLQSLKHVNIGHWQYRAIQLSTVCTFVEMPLSANTAVLSCRRAKGYCFSLVPFLFCGSTTVICCSSILNSVSYDRLVSVSDLMFGNGNRDLYMSEYRWRLCCRCLWGWPLYLCI